MTAFRELHRSGLLTLPNVWDAGSAALMRSLGARAIATTSAGVAWALGWPDGDALPLERVVQAARDVVRAAQGLPVSVDLEGGYSDNPTEVAVVAREVVEAGAQGINIEDGGGSPELLAAKISAIRGAVGGALFINARCDLWLMDVGEAESRAAEAARRGGIYRAAGADGLFAPRLVDEAAIAQLAQATQMPLNLLAFPGLPDARTLEALGVRRLSAGSGIVGAALGRAATLTKSFLQDGRSAPLMDGALGWGELNALMPDNR